MTSDENNIKRCLELAKKGLGFVAPNPLVGSVIVKDGDIIAEGYHEKFGGPHAEINAINRLPKDIKAKDCTLYVNLEPCNHQGKTGPCSRTIVEAGFMRVVIGMTDPYEKVNGSGIEFLEKNGVEVTKDVLLEDCQFLNRRFVISNNAKRPYIILKWAESEDGYMGKVGEEVKISNWDAQKLNHQWRSQEAAILIGKNTYLTDHPKLDARHWDSNNPAKWLIWGKSEMPKLDDSWNTWNSYNLDELMETLWKHNVQSVIVEGGQRILNSFLETDLYDEVRIIKSRHFRIENGIKAPAKPNINYQLKELAQDNIYTGIR